MSTDKEKALRKAEKYVLRGNIAAAIDQIRRVVDEDPDDLTSTNTLGDLYVRAGEIRAAIPHFMRIAQKYRNSGFIPKAIGVLKKIARLDGTNVEAAMELADLYCERGLVVEARRLYLQTAETAERTSRQETVREAFQKIVEMEPHNTTARLKLAELCQLDGLLERACAWCLMACDEFARQEDYDQALEASLKALELLPDSRPAIVAVSTCYSKKGDVDLAVETLSQALERNPGDAELRVMLGRTFLTAGLARDAELVFALLVDSDPAACRYLIAVGQSFLDAGDHDEVIRLIETYFEAIVATAQVNRSVDLLRSIVAEDERQIGALKLLAQIFQRTNRHEDLVATLTTLAEQAADQGAEEEAMEALNSLEDLTNWLSDHNGEPTPDTQQITHGENWQFSPSIDPEPVADEDQEWESPGSSSSEHTLDEGLTGLANENILIHVALKELYQQAGSLPEAAAKCVELAEIHEARGESSRATEYIAEAHRLTRSTRLLPPTDPLSEDAVASRSGILLPVGEDWLGGPGAPSLQLQPVEYNLSHYMGQLSRGESLVEKCLEAAEFEVSSDAIAEIDGRFQACMGSDASAGEIFEAYKLAIGSLTMASRHRRAQTDAAVSQKLSRAYLMVVEAFSSLLSVADGSEYPRLVNGLVDISIPASLSMALSPGQLLEAAHAIQRSETSLVIGGPWANRRKVERYAQRLPVLVTANSENWRELTESLDVSALGMRFRLSRSVEPGTTLHIEVAMPEHLRIHRQEGRIYTVTAVVCHQVEEIGGSRLVGAEFGAVLDDEVGNSELITASRAFYRSYSAAELSCSR
jgi:tetratricopeptide (TPR) repeat protein